MAQKLATPRILEVEKERLKHSWKSLALPLPSQVMLLSYINKVEAFFLGGEENKGNLGTRHR